MKPGETAIVDITSVNSEGEGIARLESSDAKKFVIFVPGALPGERVKCRILRLSKNYAAAGVLDILSPSPDRVTPQCTVYNRCGGCQLQHARYSAQLEFKKKILTDAMRMIGRTDLESAVECIPSPEEWGYRNKTVLPVGMTVGYYERRSHNIVPFSGCPVLKPQIEKTMTAIIESLEGSGFKGYNESKKDGDIRYIAARSGELNGTAEVLSGVVAARDLKDREFGKLRNIHQRLGAQNPNLIGSVMNIKTRPDNFIWGPVFKSLCGKKILNTMLDKYVCSLDISAFFQINIPQAERMFSYVKDKVRRYGSSSLLELYSGVGSLTLFLAEAAEKIDAVEEWRPAARQMAENMERNSASNVHIFTESAEGFIQKAENQKFLKYDTIVLDPPRTGCLEGVVSGIRIISPETIIYISCNPATLARDVARIAEDGKYVIDSLTAYDMFPQTAHVESVCVMRRKRGN
ncbi:MAG: 23S rRNA (uracil(1939)-C(5))-methyltransferase RlmD [Synergistaceae bacterium]|jgi:23S rRNA (uracil1939-C5)-methyltransferase|nr:23S rRNA (uracil(1939)-C(5))-methyltransferase RlmD [Synergistaceae bacterium]